MMDASELELKLKSEMLFLPRLNFFPETKLLKGKKHLSKSIQIPVNFQNLSKSQIMENQEAKTHRDSTLKHLSVETSQSDFSFPITRLVRGSTFDEAFH